MNDTPTAAPMREDFLTQLRRVAADRMATWCSETELPCGLFHATELGGEVGEVLNVVKKLHREAQGWRGSRATVADLAEEIGDVVVCLDKLAAYYGIDLAQATAAKFNATSEKVGLPHRLPDSSPTAHRAYWKVEPSPGAPAYSMSKADNARRAAVRIDAGEAGQPARGFSRFDPPGLWESEPRSSGDDAGEVKS